MQRPPASVELLIALKKVLGPRRIRWYLFGAQAAVVYGSARMTMDVDVTIALRPERVRPLVAALLERGFASRAHDIAAFFERSRVIPLFHESTRMPLDLVVARDSLEATFLERARPIDIGGVRVPVISPEDLVVAKLFAGRPRDIEDVRSVLAAMHDSLDLRHVRVLLGQLDEAEDRADLLPTLERLLGEAED